MFFGLNDVAFLAAAAGGAALDPDAAAYIAAVEAADTQALEPAVREAINAFVVGCKADGIWAAIKASCILAGARTLTGALVPLVGAAPTNVSGSFVADDYNRKTGLKGDGSSKLLNTETEQQSVPLNNAHLTAFFSDIGSLSNRPEIDADRSASSSSWTFFNFCQTLRINNGNLTVAGAAISNTFVGVSRNTSTGFSLRRNNSTSFVTAESNAIFVNANKITLFGTSLSLSNPRISFYSIGESLNLDLLNARVTALINAFAAAIP
jgi:hypothetical protein